MMAARPALAASSPVLLSIILRVEIGKREEAAAPVWQDGALFIVAFNKLSTAADKRGLLAVCE
jgi:hypothetical protein